MTTDAGKGHLTKRGIESLHYSGTRNRRCVLWDDNPRGLGLRVFPSGRKSFVLSYRVNGRKRLMALGDFGVLSLQDARARAKDELRSVEKGQTDPLAEKQRRALEARTGTVEAMFRAYVVDTAPKRPESPLWYGEKFIFPKFGARPWRELRRSDVREWHKGIASNYNANRALQALRAAYYWRLFAEDDAPGEGALKHDTRNPCAGIALRPERKRQVRLELAELPKLESAIDAETDDPYLRAYFRFVLAIGSRKTEALRLKWENVKLDGKTPAVIFADSKSGDDHEVALPPYCVALLRRLPRVEGNPFVFVGRRKGEHLQSPNKAWARIRTRAGVSHVRIHDLRRSFGSWLGDAGFTSKQIGSVLGHKTDITSRVYMALGSKSQREAVVAVEKLMSSARRRSRSAKVLRFRKSAAE